MLGVACIGGLMLLAAGSGELEAAADTVAAAAAAFFSALEVLAALDFLGLVWMRA